MAYDAFLLIPGIPGASTSTTHKNQIEIESFSWGAASSVPEPPPKQSGATKATAAPFTFAKITDIASPLLFLALVQTTRIPTVTLSLQKSGGAGANPPDFMTIIFTNVFISQFTSAGSAGADTPGESVAFVYDSLQVSYVPTNPATGMPGTPVTAKWDFLTNMVV
jgi:type VI secretion system secreted protein Hcp